jgi:transcriptional regulator with XRE-family HTH domain
MVTGTFSKLDGLNLKIRRLKAGLLQYDLAVQVGIAPCQLSLIENGRRQPSTELLRRIYAVIEAAAREKKQTS